MRSLKLTKAEWDMLKAQAQKWSERRHLTSEKGGRPSYLSSYVGWIVRERQRLGTTPRADSGKRLETKRRYARSVALWSPTEHRYDGPPKVPRASLCLRRSLLTEFPKEGDAATRRRALDAAQLEVVSAVEGRTVLDPLTLSSSEVGRLAWFKPADAIRFCEVPS